MRCRREVIGMILDWLFDFITCRLESYHLGLLLLSELESHHSRWHQICTSCACCDRVLCGHQLVCLREEAVQGATSGVRPIQRGKGCGISIRRVQSLHPGQYRRHGWFGEQRIAGSSQFAFRRCGSIPDFQECRAREVEWQILLRQA